MLWLHALTRLLYSKPLDFQMGLLKIVRSGSDGVVVVPSWSTFYNPLKDRNDYILQSQVRNLPTLSPLEIDQLLIDICQSLETQCQAMDSRCKALLESDYEEGCTWKEDLGGRFTFVKKNGSILCTPRLVYRILIRHSCSSSYYPVLVQPRIHISPGIPIHIRHLGKRYATFFYDWIYEQNEVRPTTRRARTLRKVVLLHDVHAKVAYLGLIQNVSMDGMIEVLVKPTYIVRVKAIREIVKESGLFEARVEYPCSM
jgi:hypothetical protein